MVRHACGSFESCCFTSGLFLGALQQASFVSTEQIALDRRPEMMHQSETQFSKRFCCELFLQLLQEWQHLLHGHNS